MKIIDARALAHRGGERRFVLGYTYHFLRKLNRFRLWATRIDRDIWCDIAVACSCSSLHFCAVIYVARTPLLDVQIRSPPRQVFYLHTQLLVFLVSDFMYTSSTMDARLTRRMRFPWLASAQPHFALIVPCFDCIYDEGD